MYVYQLNIIFLGEKRYTMWALFKNSNFTKLFFGRVVTNIGDSIYAVAAMWLVYELSSSAFYTGLAGFLTRIPQTFQFLAGPLIDRWSLRRTLVVTQLLQFIFVLIIPIAYYAGMLTVTVVLVVMPLIATVEQFAYPAQTVALPKIIKKEQLVKGNTLFSFAYQGIDLAFYGVAGILVTMIGAVSIYLLDSITFAIALLLFWSLHIPNDEKRIEKRSSGMKAIKNYGKDLLVGFRFVYHSIIRKFFIATVAANFTFGVAFAVMPVYADFRGGSTTYGFLIAAFSGGFLIGALLTTVFEHFPLGMTMIVTYLFSTIAWVSSVFIPSQWGSIIVFGLAIVPLGATQVLMAAAGQRMIPEDLLARVFSVITSVSAASMPIGSLIGGIFGDLFGGPIIFALGSLGMLFVSLVWLIIPELRTIPKVDAIDPHKYGLADKVS